MNLLPSWGKRSPKETVAALEMELEQLNADGAAALAAVHAGECALETIEDEAEFLPASAKAVTARNRLRKIENDIAQVRAKLEAARNAARVALHAELKAEYVAAMRAFLKEASKLLDRTAAVTSACEALYLAGFQAEYQFAPRLPWIGTALALDQEIIGRLESELGQFSAPGSFFSPDVYTRDPVLAAASAAALTAQAIKAAPSRKREPASRLPEPVHPATPSSPIPRARLDEIAGEGEQLVTVLRTGLEIDGKGQLRAGDRVAVPVQQAEVLMKNGAAEPAWLAADGKGDPVASVTEC